MFTVLATSWTLFSGPTNYISLATAAFFGIGMYIVAAASTCLPFPVLIVIAGIAGASWPLVVGLATLRISGVYFVIFTLGLAELVRQIVAWVQNVMGASSGLYVLITMPDRHALLAVARARRDRLPDRLVDRPLAARLRAAHHRQ